MTIATTIAALQTLHAAVAGIESAPTEYPAVIDTAELPLVLVWPGPAQWAQHTAGLGLQRQERTYLVRVFVQPTAQGEGTDEGLQRAIPILQAMGTAYLEDITLNGAVDQIRNGFADGGLDNLIYGAQSYRGFEFTLQIVEKAT